MYKKVFSRNIIIEGVKYPNGQIFWSLQFVPSSEDIHNTETLRKVPEKFLLIANKIVTKESLEQKICNTCRLKLLKLSMQKYGRSESDQEVRLLFYFIVTFWIVLFSRKFSYKKIVFFFSINFLVNINIYLKLFWGSRCYVSSDEGTNWRDQNICPLGYLTLSMLSMILAFFEIICFCFIEKQTRKTVLRSLVLFFHDYKHIILRGRLVAAQLGHD